jgi:peptidyl-prolyl cis-trans isomerase SurA
MKAPAAILALALGAAAAGAQTTPPAAARADTTRSELDRVIAVVGTHPILESEVEEIINQRRAQGMAVPTDSAGRVKLYKQVIDELIDAEVLVMKARDEKIEVADADVAQTVDQQVKRLRSQFRTETEYQSALKGGGFGNAEEYKRWLTDQARRGALQQRLIQKLRQDGKIPAVPVSEEDINTAFTEKQGTLPKRPSTVTFRQVILPVVPSDTARARARAKADSLLVELRKGGDFEQVAKRESMDPASKELGGDLGWNRRDSMVEPFNTVMFSVAPGQTSNVFETVYGFHILRVDRVRAGEVKARHILIRPKLDSMDVERTRIRADSVLAMWKGGTPFDSLVARYHDPDEEKGALQPFPRDSLPPSYRTAFEGKTTSDFVPPFPIPDPTRGVPKYVVARILQAEEGGDYTINDVRNVLREQLAEERAFRRLIDTLRKATYVSIRI